MGTPPPKPLNCKSVSNHCGALVSDRWAEPIGEEFFILGAIFSFVLSDIIKTLFCYRSQSFTFRCRHSPSVSGKQKTLLAQGEQGVEILFRFFTCLPPDYPKWLRDLSHDTTWIDQG
jgi:hypothetical protein